MRNAKRQYPCNFCVEYLISHELIYSSIVSGRGDYERDLSSSREGPNSNLVDSFLFNYRKTNCVVKNSDM